MATEWTDLLILANIASTYAYFEEFCFFIFLELYDMEYNNFYLACI